jgi:sec-independent protein translocase protein TatB
MGVPLPIQLSSLGMADSLILMVLALVVFGPRRLPQIGRQIGKLMYEFRKASNDFKFQMEEELRLSEEADRRKKEEAERARVAALPPPTSTSIIEAGTNVAVTEQASVSAQPPVSTEPSPETSAALPEPPEPEHAPYPRTVPVIQPPTVGEQVPTDRPNAAAAPSAAPDPVPAENNSTEPASPSAPPGDHPRSETVSQHG